MAMAAAVSPPSLRMAPGERLMTDFEKERQERGNMTT